MSDDPRPGDRVLVRNAAGGYLSHTILGRLVETEYVVREIDPVLGVRLIDGWYASACVERVGGPSPVHTPPDPHTEALIAERGAWTGALHDLVLSTWQDNLAQDGTR